MIAGKKPAAWSRCPGRPSRGAGRQWPGRRIRCAVRRLTGALAGAAVALGVASAAAAPEAHILRIDPRASTVDGAPVLTTVLEVVQNKRMSDQTRECAALPG